jgi:hypothetical protein
MGLKIEGDMSTATAIMSGGKKTMSYLSWRWADSNVYLWRLWLVSVI